MKTVTLQLADYLAAALPTEESSIYKILKLGLKQFRTEQAIRDMSKAACLWRNLPRWQAFSSGKLYILLMPTDWNPKTINRLSNPK